MPAQRELLKRIETPISQWDIFNIPSQVILELITNFIPDVSKFSSLKLEPLIQEIRDLILEIKGLTMEIKNLQKELKKTRFLPEEEKEIELETVPKEEAKKMILEYVDKNPKCFTSDIILNLKLNPDLVLEILGELEHEGKIKGVKPGT